MPTGVGGIVRLHDERLAIVSAVSDEEDGADRVLFSNGKEENTDAWEIREVLTDELDEDEEGITQKALLAKLREYIREQEEE